MQAKHSCQMVSQQRIAATSSWQLAFILQFQMEPSNECGYNEQMQSMPDEHAMVALQAALLNCWLP
jgi:hypothetical protein